MELNKENKSKIKKLKTDNDKSLKKNKKRTKETVEFDKIDIKKVKLEYPECKVVNSNHNGNIHNDENNTSIIDDNNEEDNEVAVKYSSKEVDEMTGKYLRKSFSTEGGINILKKFIAICHDNGKKDLIGEYLEAGGSILEILRLLDATEKKNLKNASVIFSAIYLIIMRIIEKYPQHQSNVGQACRHILNSHLSLIHSMMSQQSIPKQRKIILQFLTAMVALGENLPRELLTHLSFHSQVIEFLAQQTKPTDSESVRKCFIHFILAFLVDGNSLTIKSLLDKRGLLSSIFPGLLYDSHSTVHLVLTTIKTYILENNSIMKTTKLHVFSTPVVKSLVSLYNWKGPESWPGINKKHTKIIKDVDPDEKKVVTEAVHTFLITLLTSTRYGIIFNDKSLGTSGRKHNQLVNTVLESLDKPWEHEKPRHLVIKVLSVCPDLIKSQLIYTETFLEPRISPKWISVMEFINEIIKSIDPDNLEPYLVELSVLQITSASLTFAMPQLVLKNAIQPSITSSSIIIRQQACTMLLIMIQQIKKFFKIVKNNFNESDFNSYQSAVVNYMQKNMPSVKQILSMWNLTLKAEEPLEPLNSDMVTYLPEKIDHLASIVELLEHYRDISSKLFDTNFLDISNKLSEIDLFTDLNNIKTNDINKLNEIKIKLIEINFQLNPTAFNIEERIFSKSLKFLISLIEKDSSKSDKTSSMLDRQAKNAIKILLKSLKAFQGCDNQIDIWVNCLSYFEKENKNAVTRWLLKVIKHEVKNQVETLKTDEKNKTETKEKRTLKKEERYIPDIMHNALDYLKNDTNENGSIFMSYVIVLTLHYQKNPTELKDLIKDMHGLPNKYVTSWIEGTPVSLKKYFPHNVISNYSKILLSKETIKFEKLFTGDKLVSFDYGGQKIEFKHQLTIFEALEILQMTIFYLIQFMKTKQLHQELLERFKKTIITFLNIAKSLNEENEAEDVNLIAKFSNMIFSNVMLLQYFSVIVNDNCYEILTASWVEIIKTAVSINNSSTMKDILFLFRNKFIFELNLLISTTTMKFKLSSYAVELIEVFALTNEDMFNLFEKIVNLPVDIFMSNNKSLSSWGIIIPKLIELLTTSTTANFKTEKLIKNIQRVINHLIELKMKQKIKLIETWETSLIKFFHKHSEYIFTIDDKLFKRLLNTDLIPSTISLIRLIMSKNDKLIPVLIECYKSNSKLQNQNIIFSIMSTNSTYQWSQEFLADLFNKYNEEIILYFTFSTTDNMNGDWIVNNVGAISCLITSCFNENICNRISNTIVSSGDKLEMVDINYIKLLRVLYKKLTTFKNNRTVVKEFIQILLRITVYSLKKNTKDDEKMFILCEYLSEAVDDFKQSQENGSFEELSKTSSWPQFIRFSLKQGLKRLTDKNNKNNQSDEREKLLENKKTPPLLDTIANLTDVIYQDNSEDPYVKTIFEMTTSHSEFINLMLSNGNQVKKNLLKLLLVLIRKNKSLMLPTQIPLFLSAYNATLSESDQLILLILRHYEASEIRLSNYKPYLWGEAAANHYSVKGDIDTSLLRQPSVAQVIELFYEDIINSTVVNFPIDRSLKSTELYPPSNVYDPAFFLPLLISSFSVDNVIPCYKIIKSGTLSLIFAACGTTCEEIRLAAFTVLARFYFHLEATKSKNKLLWIRFIDALRNGIVSMKEQAEMNSLKNIQLNCFITTFLAKASLISARPLNPLFVPIQSFLMAKPALVLQGIPEFLTLFHSSDINHKLHRHWILEVIRDGMKTDADLKLAFKFSIFRMICDFYHCSLADLETKNLILQILRPATKIKMGSMILIRDYGLLVWLKEVARKIEKHNLNNVDVILDIIENILNTFNLMKITHENLNHYKFIISSVLNSLNEHIPKDDMAVNDITCKYYNCFTQISK